jgi:hypothetical protein
VDRANFQRIKKIIAEIPTFDENSIFGSTFDLSYQHDIHSETFEARLSLAMVENVFRESEGLG